MANSTNHKNTTTKNSKTNNGKITVRRENSDADIKKVSASRSSSNVKRSSTGSKSGANGAKSSANSSRSSANGSRNSANSSKSGANNGIKSGANSSNNNSGRSANGAGKSSAAKGNSGKKTASQSSTPKPAGRRVQKQQKAKKLIVAFELIGILLFVAVGTAIYMSKKGETTPVDTVVKQDATNFGIMVDGVNISMMTIEQAKQVLMNKHPWSLTVTFDDQEYEADNYLEKEIDAILYDAFASRADAEYTISISDPDSVAATIAKTVSDMWSQPPVDSSITGYDEESGEFILSDSQPGRVIDVDALTGDISKQLTAGNYTAKVLASAQSSEPTVKKEDYQVLGTFKTTTTSNENRNTNIRIACDTIRGTILQPQEQFSYNTILGPRTEAKGYKEAGAYANGEHVLELGGGICQVSSTIYNAAIFAGLQIDQRTGHTYEPSYVTPGEDAAVSYSNPDFVFSNNSNATLGIKTVYKDRTIVATVFGVSILPEGVKQYMRSEKIGDIDPPPDITVDDPMVPPGQPQVVSGPKNGSRWKTYLIQEKDGQIISEVDYHTTTYRGTAAEIHVNMAGVDPAAYAAQQAAIQAQQAAEAAQAAAQQQAEQQQQEEEAAQ